jgi:tRNA threonylcarbamoyladenosine biosynthesis protein TsaE
VTSTPEETEAAGEKLARHLGPGDLLLLVGELGAGKTTFVRGLGRGLGVDGLIQSPTFQLLRLHSGEPPLAHADLYRLPAGSGVDDLGLDELLDSAVVVVEWGERLPQAVHENAVLVRFLFDARGRRIRLEQAPAQWSLS